MFNGVEGSDAHTGVRVTGAVALLEPLAFVATTVNEYAVLVVNPVTVQVRAEIPTH